MGRFAALALVFCGASVEAAPLSVPQIQSSTVKAFRYVCRSGKSLSVTYLNTRNKQSFAVLAVDGRELLFVNVLSGSGAKYVADRYTWWTKGPEGTLTDNTADASAPPVFANCKSGS